jgi:drug/metabolite transporter (DMT)-like permease
VELNLARSHRAALLAIAGGFSFTAIGAIVRHISDEVPLSLIVFSRMAVALLLSIAIVARQGLDQFRTRRTAGLFLRSLTGTVSLLFFVYALAHLPLADAIALSFTTPLWAIPVAALLLGERTPRARWIWTAIGFVGVVILLRPAGTIHVAALAALASAILSANSATLTRGLSTTETPDRIVLYFTFFGALTSLPFALYWWQTPTPMQFVWLVVIGVLATLGLSCSARALSMSEVTFLAPFDFLRLPFAAILGFIFFAEIPDLWMLIGVAVITASIYAIIRQDEARRRGAS